MNNQTIDIAHGQVNARKKIIAGLSHLIAHKRRDMAREDNAQPIVFNTPAHHIPRTRPGMLAPTFHHSTRGVGIGHALGFCAQQKGRRAVAKNRCTDNVSLTVIGAAERQATQFRAHK